MSSPSTSFSYRILLVALIVVAFLAAIIVLIRSIYPGKNPMILPSTTQTPVVLFPTTFPSPTDAPPDTKPGNPTSSFRVRWVEPSAALTVARGNMIHLVWEASGVSPNARIYFSLVGPGVQTQIESFLAKTTQGDFPVRVPPGNYTLKLISPTGINTIISVAVTGSAPVISSQDSTIMFDTPGEVTGTIIADGYCAIRVTAQIVDGYGYGIAGKQVTLHSSRGNKDRISKTLATTSSNGRIQFLITSKTPGTSLLSARVGNVDLTNTLTLRVYDTQNFSCPHVTIL